MICGKKQRVPTPVKNSGKPSRPLSVNKSSDDSNKVQVFSSPTTMSTIQKNQTRNSKRTNSSKMVSMKNLNADNNGNEYTKKNTSVVKDYDSKLNTAVNEITSIASLSPVAVAAPRKGILKQSKSQNYPVLTDIGICTALPGTREWALYWEQYDVSLAEYKKSEAAFLKDNPEYKQDIDNYSKEAARLSLEDDIFRESIGLHVKKSQQVFRVPVVGLRTLNGFVFDRDGGVNGLSAYLSSSGSEGFRLEIDVREYDAESIVIESQFNLMKIQVPIDSTRSRHKNIVIGVPSDYKLEDLEVYHSNGWLIVEISADRMKMS